MYGYANEIHKVVTGLAYLKWGVTTISSFIKTKPKCDNNDIVIIEIAESDEGDDFYKLSLC